MKRAARVQIVEVSIMNGMPLCAILAYMIQIAKILTQMATQTSHITTYPMIAHGFRFISLFAIQLMKIVRAKS